MPKSIVVDPAKVRQRSTIKINDIPVNAYQGDFATEKKKYGDDGLKTIYRDMAFIREFETMLDEIKRMGSYQGIEYNHKGTGPPLYRTGSGGGRPVLQPRRRRSDLRLPPEPRRDPRQMFLRRSQAFRRASDGDYEELYGVAPPSRLPKRDIRDR